MRRAYSKDFGYPWLLYGFPFLVETSAENRIRDLWRRRLLKILTICSYSHSVLVKLLGSSFTQRWSFNAFAKIHTQTSIRDIPSKSQYQIQISTASRGLDIVSFGRNGTLPKRRKQPPQFTMLIQFGFPPPSINKANYQKREEHTPQIHDCRSSSYLYLSSPKRSTARRARITIPQFRMSSSIPHVIKRAPPETLSSITTTIIPHPKSNIETLPETPLPDYYNLSFQESYAKTAQNHYLLLL
jgi:hypothetical protein